MILLHQRIEHTLLKPDLLQKDIEKLIEEAVTYQFYGICVPPYWVKKCRRDLGRTAIALVTVVGFPLGYHRSEVKLFETEKALEDGADEVDLVMNMTAFKNNPKEWVKPEIAQLAQRCHKDGKVLKVILETAYLSNEEIAVAAKLCADAGADFIKTSTGFAPTGATVEHVKIIRQAVGDNVGIKASGGIKTLEQAQALIEAGADRIGTSSGVKIMNELKNAIL